MNLHIPGTFNSLFKFLNSINGIFARALSKPVKSKTRTPFFHCEVVCVCIEHSMSKTSLNVFGLITTWFFILFGLFAILLCTSSLKPSYLLACLIICPSYSWFCYSLFKSREKEKKVVPDISHKNHSFHVRSWGMRNTARKRGGWFFEGGKKFLLFSNFFPSSLLITTKLSLPVDKIFISIARRFA